MNCVRHAVHVRGGNLAPAIPLQEEKPPVAGSDGARQAHAERGGIGEGFVDRLQRPRPHAVDLGVGDRVSAHLLQRGDQRFARGVDRIGERNLREEREQSGVVERGHEVADAGGLARVDQRFVQASGRRDGHHVRQREQRHVVGVRARHDVIADADELRVARASQHDLPLAVLHRLHRVEARQRARGAGDRAEVAGDGFERGLRLEAAGDHQHRVVRLVVGPIERSQPVDIDVLDVGAGADRRLAVVVPDEGGRGRAAAGLSRTDCSRRAPFRFARRSSRCPGPRARRSN